MTLVSEETQDGGEQETTAATNGSVCELQSLGTDGEEEDEHMKCNVIPFGLQQRAGYVHGKAYSDLMGVTYDGRMKQFILLDSKGVTTWSKDAVRKKGVRALNFGQFQHRSITSIVYGRNMNIYFALGKDFDLMVLNRDFQQTCKVSSQLRSVVFMVFNPATNELITGGVGGTKIWKYEQLAELSWSSLTPMSNYQLVLKRELPNVGGSWVKRVDLEERLQQLYCCSSMDIHAYRMDGSEVFTFLRAHTLGITGCVYSHTAQLLVSSAEDTTVKVWNVKGGWIHTFHGHSRGVTNLLLHPECHATAVTSSLDGSVRMWSLHTLEPLYSVVVSSDGIKWMGLMDDNLLYLSTLRELTVWSLNHVTDFWALTRCHIKQLSLAHSVGKSTCVTALGDDSSVRVLCRASGRKLSTVLPPPDLSPMAQILCVTYNRAAKVIYLLLNTKVVWVYTTRTDPACRLYVWDIISIQEELSHDYNYQLTAGCSNPFVDAHTHARTLVTLVECRTICYLESPVVVQTPTGQCCPLRDNFLLMGLEDGRVLFMDPLVRAKQHVLMVADKDALVELRHDISHNMLVTRCDKREVTVIQFWSLPYLQCLTEFVCPLDMTGFIRLNTTLITAHEDGSVVRHCLPPPDVSTTVDGTTRLRPKPPVGRTILKCGQFDRVADHPGPVIAIDVSVHLGMFCTASADGVLKIWDERKCLLTEIMVDESLTSVCFLNTAGDLLLGYRNHIFTIGHRRVCPYWEGSAGDSDDDEEVSLFEGDIYEDPAIKFDLGAGRDSPDPVTLQNYLVPYDVAFGKKVSRYPSLSDLTDRDDLSSLDIASDWESELDPADTDTYMSPKEGSDSPHLIDLTLTREVTAFDLAIHAAAAKKQGRQPHKHDTDTELDFDLPNFGISPGRTPTPSTPSTLLTPSSINVSEGGESSSAEEEQEEPPPRQPSPVQPTSVAPPTSDVVTPLPKKPPFQSRLSMMTIDSKSLMRRSSGRKREILEEQPEPTETPPSRTASLGQIKKKDMKTSRQLPRRAVSQPNPTVRKEDTKTSAVKHHKPKAKQQPVKSVRQMPVATVTDNVATKAKRNEPQGGAAVRSIPTSSVTIKPKTGYSYNGATDSGVRKASVAKPQRAKQLIQAPPAKKSSGKAKTTTSEISPGIHLPTTPVDRAASIEVKMYAVIGELEAPSVGLINELTGGDVVEKAQSRSILKSGCSSPLARLSDGVTFSASERDGVSTPGGFSITSAGQMAQMASDMSLRPDSGTIDSGRTSRNLLIIDEGTDGKTTPGPSLHDLTASPTIYSDYGSEWTYPGQHNINVEEWYRANAQQMQEGFPEGKYLGGRAVTCGTPSGRPNTPAEERARAWRPYTAMERGEPSREELEHDFLEALRRYRGSVMLACRDNLHQNDGTVFGEDWQEREIERHQLLRMQRQLRVRSAAEKRAGVDKEKQRRQTTLLGHTSCAPPGDSSKTAEVEPDSDTLERPLNQDANVAAFISILEHSRSVTAFGMAPQPDQSHDMKQRPFTAAPAVHSQVHRANMLPNTPEGLGHTEHSAKYIAVDKRDRSVDAPFRGRISMVPCGRLFTHLSAKDIDIKQFDPKHPATAFRIQSSKSIPNRCSRYILVRRPCSSAQQVATPLEEQLILERFPHLQHQWLGDAGCFRRPRPHALSHQPTLMHHQKLLNQMREIQRRQSEGATK